MKYGFSRAAVAMVAAVLTTGIGCQTPPPPPPKPVYVYAVPAARSAATAELVTRTTQFNLDVARFPGSGDEHRQILTAVLANLSKMLRLANGPVESPEFANRISVIDAADTTAGVSDLPHSRMEAVENQALGAATGAATEISTRYLFDDDQLPGLLTTLATQVDAATKSLGPMHDLDATTAFTALQAVMQQISNDMVERFGTAAAPQAPTVAMPAMNAAPATMPTSMPATMP